MTSPRIALVGRPDKAALHNTPDSLTPDSLTPDNYQSLGELLDGPVYDLILINLPAPQTRDTVQALRSHSRYHLTLIYTDETSDPQTLSLVDGTLPETVEELPLKWRLWQERISMFNNGRPPRYLEERVLAWLWTRPSSHIEPIRSPENAQFYSYPLLAYLSGDEPLGEIVWLKLMTEQGLLQPGQITDRIRLCRECDSARLNYVDVCPQCQALDIVRQPSLHCFTCGHVAPQEQFLKGGIMLCPNCLSRLRHIGSDYDRPLENHRCRSCHHFFSEPDVQARCFDCNEAQTPDELKVREYHAYGLTEQGRLRCRQGLTNTTLADYLGRLSLIPPASFEAMLDWEIQKLRRYPESPACSLMVIRFNWPQSSRHQNDQMARLDTLIERIQETVRDTDRCTRTNEDLLWLLLPHTNNEGRDGLSQRLSGLTNHLEDNNGDSPVQRIGGYTLPNSLLSEEDASLLMARLGGEVT